MNELMSGKTPVGAPFALRDPAGKLRKLDEFRGRLVLLYFGYTHCPDVCPTDLVAIASALNQLGSGAADIQPVFITLDPARDTPKALRVWLNQFDKRFIGLTGSQSAIDAVQAAAGVPVAAKVARPGDDYAVGHANFVIAYTKDNLAHVIYPGGVTRQDWAHDLPQLVNETWSSR